MNGGQKLVKTAVVIYGWPLASLYGCIGVGRYHDSPYHRLRLCSIHHEKLLPFFAHLQQWMMGDSNAKTCSTMYMVFAWPGLGLCPGFPGNDEFSIDFPEEKEEKKKKKKKEL